MHKIYREGNYIRVISTTTGELFNGTVKEVFVDKNNTQKNAYRLFNVKDLKEDTVFTIPNILKEDGAAYSISEWETFYTENTGNFNGGGAAPEILENKVNTYTVDGTGEKYYTADYINTGVLHTTGDETKNGILGVNISLYNDSNQPPYDYGIGRISAIKGVNTSIYDWSSQGGYANYSGNGVEGQGAVGVLGVCNENDPSGLGITGVGVEGRAIQYTQIGYDYDYNTEIYEVIGGSYNTGVRGSSISGIGVDAYSSAGLAGHFRIYNGSKIVSFVANNSEVSYILSSGLFKANKILVNTTTDNGVDAVQVPNGSVLAKQYKLASLNTAPTSATATGTTGDIRYTADFIYVCIATNTWRRTPLTTW
jgi:hypothetical protein